MQTLRRIGQFFLLALATLFALSACLCVRGAYASKFAQIKGDRTFYLDSPSSQALAVNGLTWKTLFRVKGESVQFAFSGDEAAKREKVEEFFRTYGAEVLFVEEAGDTLSYYCYTPQFGEGVVVNGTCVNLHLAISAERMALGYPIIFGGF